MKLIENEPHRKSQRKKNHVTRAGEEEPRPFLGFERENLWAYGGYEINSFLASAWGANACSPAGTAIGQ